MKDLTGRSSDRLFSLYQALRRHYGHRGWWPLGRHAGEPGYTPSGYHPGYDLPPEGLTPEDRLEIILGALLTQNTNWRNASGALKRLLGAVEPTPEALLALSGETREELIRQSGFFRQKSARIEVMMTFLREKGFPRETVTREELLFLKGVGPETADSILLYAYGEPHFIIDAYTRRVLTRWGGLQDLPEPKAPYQQWQEYCEARLPREAALYRDYHAQFVQLCKEACRTRPLCSGCPVEAGCAKNDLPH